jgi:NAD dependent epimerase/dehydratase
VLVTGAGGFIGSHLCEELVRRGADVTAVVRYTSRPDPGNLVYAAPEVLDEIEVVRGDLTDPLTARRLVAGAETVFHLAASISVPYSFVAPSEVVAANVLGTLAMLDAARASGVARFIQMSSSEVYGTAQGDFISEEHVLAPQSPYAASKIGADKLAESYWRTYDMAVVVARPFNTYGPRQSARAVIPTIINQALHADEIRIGSTAPTRDFVFVLDTVEGLLRLAESDRAVGQTINIGTGTDVSVGDVIEQVKAITGFRGEVVAEEGRVRPANAEVGRLIADVSLLEQTVGWRPGVSLEDGLRAAVEFFREHPAAATEYAI